MPALVIINMTYLNGKLSTKGSYKPCIHQHLPTPTHTYSHPAKKGHTHPHPAKNMSHSPTPTDTQPKKRSHSPTPSQKKVITTHTRPGKGHIHPHPAKKMVTNTHTHPHPAKKWSHPPTHNWRKECHVSNTYIREKYSLFTILFLLNILK